MYCQSCSTVKLISAESKQKGICGQCRDAGKGKKLRPASELDRIADALERIADAMEDQYIIEQELEGQGGAYGR